MGFWQATKPHTPHDRLQWTIKNPECALHIVPKHILLFCFLFSCFFFSLFHLSDFTDLHIWGYESSSVKMGISFSQWCLISLVACDPIVSCDSLHLFKSKKERAMLLFSTKLLYNHLLGEGTLFSSQDDSLAIEATRRVGIWVLGCSVSNYFKCILNQMEYLITCTLEKEGYSFPKESNINTQARSQGRICVILDPWFNTQRTP